MGTGRPVLVDLCCGAGGFSYGFRQAGWRVLLGADLCKHSLATYYRNLCTRTLLIDLLGKGAAKTVEDAICAQGVSAVIAGPPCQGFSRAGRRKLVDPRNDVILAAARVAVSLNPELIVLENVRNIMVPRYEEFFIRATCILRRNGYSVCYHLLNALHFGVPQDRERLVLIGSKNRNRDAIEAALHKLASIRLGTKTVSEVLNGIPLDPGVRTPETQLANHNPMRHSDKVREKIARILPGEGPLSYRKLHPGRPAATLICGHRALPCHYAIPRTITVREAARLQGFPKSNASGRQLSTSANGYCYRRDRKGTSPRQTLVVAQYGTSRHSAVCSRVIRSSGSVDSRNG
jgi:DNA (cytosine-5)-methyltransferase 1